MKQIIYKNLHLMLVFCFILFAYPVEDIQKRIGDIDRKVGTGAKEEQK